MIHKKELIRKLDRKYNWIQSHEGGSLWSARVFRDEDLNDIATGIIFQIAYFEYKGKKYNLDELIEVAADNYPVNHLYTVEEFNISRGITN